tara:strand:+ start:437 stop:859 length:423 start_codon:yes stop_codon:yes gene_type:complete
MIQWTKFASSFAGKAKGMYSKGKTLTMTGMGKAKAAAVPAMGKVKTATMKGVSKGKALASQAKSSGMAGMSKAKAFGIKQKAKFDKLSPQNKILAGTAVVGLGVGIPVKGAAFYYGAREGAALVEKRKQKKNVKKNRKTS